MLLFQHIRVTPVLPRVCITAWRFTHRCHEHDAECSWWLNPVALRGGHCMVSDRTMEPDMDSHASEEKGQRQAEEAICSPSSHPSKPLPDPAREENNSSIILPPQQEDLPAQGEGDLAEVGTWGRFVAAIMLILAILGFGGCFWMSLIDSIRLNHTAQVLPLLAVTAFLTVLSAWMLFRILLPAQTNQVTTIPPWVIQTSGMAGGVSVLGMIGLAIWQGEPLWVVVALLASPVASHMIRIRSLIRKQTGIRRVTQSGTPGEQPGPAGVNLIRPQSLPPGPSPAPAPRQSPSWRR